MSTATTIAEEIITLLKKEGHYDSLAQITAELEKELYRNTDISVVSAVELSKEDHTALEKSLLTRFGEHRFVYTVDPTLLSGLLIKFKDTVLDLTGKQSLAEFKQELS